MVSQAPQIVSDVYGCAEELRVWMAAVSIFALATGGTLPLSLFATREAACLPAHYCTLGGWRGDGGAAHVAPDRGRAVPSRVDPHTAAYRDANVAERDQVEVIGSGSAPVCDRFGE